MVWSEVTVITFAVMQLDIGTISMLKCDQVRY